MILHWHFLPHVHYFSERQLMSYVHTHTGKNADAPCLSPQTKHLRNKILSILQGNLHYLKSNFLMLKIYTSEGSKENFHTATSCSSNLLMSRHRIKIVFAAYKSMFCKFTIRKFPNSLWMPSTLCFSAALNFFSLRSKWDNILWKFHVTSLIQY